MGKALGFFEVPGVVAATDALDIMCKAADVEFVTWEKKLGGRLVTVIVSGEVSAVTAAIESATAGAIKKPVSKAVIANPHEEVERIIANSRARLLKARGEVEETVQEQPKKTPARKTKK